MFGRQPGEAVGSLEGKLLADGEDHGRLLQRPAASGHRTPVPGWTASASAAAGLVQICSTLLTPRAPGVGGGIVSSAVKARGALGAERLPLVSMSTRTIDTFTPSSVSN